MATVEQTREVYKQEVGDQTQFRWFISNARRFLENSGSLEVELLIGTKPYYPDNLEDLLQIYHELLEPLQRYFKEGKNVFCRIIFKNS